RAVPWRGALALGLLAALAGTASAQGPTFASLAADLDTDDLDVVSSALDALAATRSQAAVGPIAARIGRGLPPPLVVPAVEALELIGHPSAAPILIRLLRHRDAAVRAAAAAALAECAPRRAGRPLRAALSDLDADVRASAALALGRVRDRRAAGDLFRALERGLLEASGSLGQLADVAGIERLLGYLQRLPLRALTPGLTEALARRDLPYALKLEIVARVEDLGSPEAKRYLDELVLLFGDAPLAGAARAAARRIDP
ncbi:MAG: HEAT repeat domain-containing protein, partial [Myxococcota bacterium]